MKDLFLFSLSGKYIYDIYTLF